MDTSIPCKRDSTVCKNVEFRWWAVSYVFSQRKVRVRPLLPKQLLRESNSSNKARRPRSIYSRLLPQVERMLKYDRLTRKHTVTSTTPFVFQENQLPLKSPTVMATNRLHKPMPARLPQSISVSESIRRNTWITGTLPHLVRRQEMPSTPFSVP